MRVVTSILYSLILAGLLLSMQAASVLGDDRSEISPRREWFSLANGRNEFEVSDLSLVPSQLADAAKQSDCRYSDDIAKIPIRFISIGSYLRIAIVFCRYNVTGSHQIFDFSSRDAKQRPRVIELPIITRPEGFRSTSSPGIIKWTNESGLLEAQSNSDMCSEPSARHIYRFKNSLGGFVLTRVEVAPNSCGSEAWTTIWQSPVWIPSDTRDAQ